MRGQKKPGATRRRISRAHIDVILLEPQKSENIGSVARAMANTGLGRLILVRPRLSNLSLMEASATRQGEGILESALIFSDLPLALSPYNFIVGTTARLGENRGKVLSPRELAPTLLCDDIGRVALIFGTEREGLTTEELRLANNVVSIPTESPEASSLNLSQAVLIMGYELLLAATEEPAPLNIKAAEFSDLERAYQDLEKVLVEIGFLP
ncbi:MAG: RNA methyltransferase, partial [Deltaproteobacteria bacterium]|nr:RNA methyltransferase [Deltaproteobacteria bacterium]